MIPAPLATEGSASFPSALTPSHEGAFCARDHWFRAGFRDGLDRVDPAFVPSDIPSFEALRRLATSPSERADWAEILDKTTNYLEGWGMATGLIDARRHLLFPS